MFLTTRNWLASQATNRWKHTYPESTEETLTLYNVERKTILDKLRNLGEYPHPNRVDDIIGNGSWTRCECNECGTEVEGTVRLGEEPDWESATANICKDCLVKALALFVTDNE